MTEFEIFFCFFFVDELMEDSVTKFYARYVDKTLLVIKRSDSASSAYVLNKFNSFEINLKFTININENCVPHFFDIEIFQNGLGNYHNHTQVGQI